MFPSRYFAQRYFVSGYWANVGADAAAYPTPNVWIISTRNKNWDIEINTEMSIPERNKTWTITDTLGTDVGTFEFSWSLPTRTKEWTL